MSSVVAIIPARGGSKRVVGKNLRLLSGRPLLVHAIDAALQASCIGRTVVSTDAPDIARVARDAGAEVLIRPDDLAGDTVPDRPVYAHLLRELTWNGENMPPFLFNLRPTTPFKTPEDIDGIFDLLQTTNADCARTVTRVTDPAQHPHWLVKKCDDLAKPFLDTIDLAENIGRPLPPVYRFNGVVDAFRSSIVLDPEAPSEYGKQMALFEIPEERAMDIDTELDLQLAQLMASSPLHPSHGKEAPHG